MSSKNPTLSVHEKPVWDQVLLEHYRILLERVVSEFPEVLTDPSRRLKVEMLRIRLTV
jgi:hypothetical protein